MVARQSFLILATPNPIKHFVDVFKWPYFGVWILKGNYSGSLLFDVIPLSDPLITLESLATGHLPGILTLSGALIIFITYALLGSKVFCGWVCPLNVVTDCAAWIRRKLGIRQTAKIPRSLRYAILVMILAGSAVSGLLLWEWVNPVAALGRALIYGFGATVWLILVVFFFDLFIVTRKLSRQILHKILKLLF